MKITELISRLEELKEKYGDMEVLRPNCCCCYSYGDVEMELCDIDFNADFKDCSYKPNGDYIYISGF
jgi:hypothetical protein